MEDHGHIRFESRLHVYVCLSCSLFPIFPSIDGFLSVHSKSFCFTRRPSFSFWFQSYKNNQRSNSMMTSHCVRPLSCDPREELSRKALKQPCVTHPESCNHKTAESYEKRSKSPAGKTDDQAGQPILCQRPGTVITSAVFIKIQHRPVCKQKNLPKREALWENKDHLLQKDPRACLRSVPVTQLMCQRSKQTAANK